MAPSQLLEPLGVYRRHGQVMSRGGFCTWEAQRVRNTVAYEVMTNREQPR